MYYNATLNVTAINRIAPATKSMRHITKLDILFFVYACLITPAIAKITGPKASYDKTRTGGGGVVLSEFRHGHRLSLLKFP
jgi:hypothetical protein